MERLGGDITGRRRTAPGGTRVIGRAAASRAAEAVVDTLIALAGWTAILVLAAIAAFLVVNSARAVSEYGLARMLTGIDWYPTSDPPSFGFVSKEIGSMLVTGVAMSLSVPLGIAAAIFVSEFSRGWVQELIKSIIEFMAAVPSVVYGFIGIALVVPWVKEVFRLQSGLTALSAGLLVGFMSLPTIISISEDALHAVPDSLRQGSLALGNNRWQTVYKVVLPSASSGVFAAVMLGMGRAIGETMVVLMVAGNARVPAWDVLQSVGTLTGTIAQEMGEVVRGGLHESVLFSMGLVLFLVTFLINLAADLVLEKQRARWRR